MSLEKIVRPFQNGDVFTARTLFPATTPYDTQTSPEIAALSWGGPNPGQFITGPDLDLVGFQVEWVEDKEFRVTESVRVENPNDSSQYVMVDRMKSTVLRDDQTGRTFNMRFANWDK